MYSHWTCSHVIIVTMILLTDGIVTTLSQCPVEYWDKPSNSCAYDMVNVLRSLGDSFSLANINKTCISWEKMKMCYDELIRDCHLDSVAVDVLKSHFGRFRVYSIPCRRSNPNHLQSQSYLQNNPLMECFLAHFTSTQSCTEAFDKFFRSFVSNEQYGSACRIISTSLRCFDVMKVKISDRCGREGDEEYQRIYIQPIIEQSRAVVAARCTLAPPFDKYYTAAAPPSLLQFDVRLMMLTCCCCCCCWALRTLLTEVALLHYFFSTDPTYHRET